MHETFILKVTFLGEFIIIKPRKLVIKISSLYGSYSYILKSYNYILKVTHDQFWLSQKHAAWLNYS